MIFYRYIKEEEVTPQPLEGRGRGSRGLINFEDFMPLFQVRRRLDAGNREVWDRRPKRIVIESVSGGGDPVREILNVNTFAADFMAATLAAGFAFGLVRRKSISELLRICRAITLNEGYAESSEEHLFRSVIDAGNTTLVVLGTQNQAMLHRRVEKAAELIRMSRSKFDILFCGASPGLTKGRRKLRITDESMRMSIIFEQIEKRFKGEGRPLKYGNINWEFDSANTIENLKNALKKREVFKAKENNFAIVSSSFHLPRIAWELHQLEELARKVKEDGGKAGDQTEEVAEIAKAFNPEMIRAICLVGAETIDNFSRFRRDDIYYFKPMMFEILKYGIEGGFIDEQK